MPRRRHHIRLIAKQRPFDEEQWKRLLTAFAYVLHERRTAQLKTKEQLAAEPTTPTNGPAAIDAPASGDTRWIP